MNPIVEQLRMMPALRVVVTHAATRIGRGLTWSAMSLALLGSVRASQAEAVPPSVLPGLGPAATREAVDANQSPWRGVVRVQTDVGLHCTGALVDPRVVLTAAHCLFGRGTGRLVRPASIHVLTGYSHGEYAGHARAVTVEIGSGFAVGLNGQRLPSSPPDADWAILTLDTPLGTADRLLPLFRDLPPPGTPAMLGGDEQRPGAGHRRRRRLSGDRRDSRRQRAYAPSLLRRDARRQRCPLTRADSGSRLGRGRDCICRRGWHVRRLSRARRRDRRSLGCFALKEAAPGAGLYRRGGPSRMDHASNPRDGSPGAPVLAGDRGVDPTGHTERLERSCRREARAAAQSAEHDRR